MASIVSPSTPAAMRIQMMRLLTWPMKIRSALMRLPSVNSFGPSAVSRCAASCAYRPAAKEPSRASTSSAGRLRRASTRGGSAMVGRRDMRVDRLHKPVTGRTRARCGATRSFRILSGTGGHIGWQPHRSGARGAVSFRHEHAPLDNRSPSLVRWRRLLLRRTRDRRGWTWLGPARVPGHLPHGRVSLEKLTPLRLRAKGVCHPIDDKHFRETRGIPRDLTMQKLTGGRRKIRGASRAMFLAH